MMAKVRRRATSSRADVIVRGCVFERGARF